MALALNVFKTITKVLGTTPEKVYTAPIGYTGVALFCNIVNSGAVSYDVSISHERTVSGIAVTTPIHIQRPVSSKDSFKPFYGKFVLESGDSLIAYGSNGTELKLIASILNTLN
jgi:hypothetical protein